MAASRSTAGATSSRGAPSPGPNFYQTAYNQSRLRWRLFARRLPRGHRTRWQLSSSPVIFLAGDSAGRPTPARCAERRRVADIAVGLPAATAWKGSRSTARRPAGPRTTAPDEHRARGRAAGGRDPRPTRPGQPHTPPTSPTRSPSSPPLARRQSSGRSSPPRGLGARKRPVGRGRSRPRWTPRSPRLRWQRRARGSTTRRDALGDGDRLWRRAGLMTSSWLGRSCGW